ncbi:MAG: hypothetical protein M3O01_00640, partial [Pseudomonadota bacterium]|nr:hypothetical protein [Pseudomonadota bacterium]
MSLRRQLAVSFTVQGAGAAAVLLATLWLGARLGPQVQGGFSRVKSEIEFVVAFSMFGLPQALFYHLKSGAMSPGAALDWALGSAAVAIPIGLGYAVLAHAGLGLWAIFALTLAIAAGVAHGQLRGLLLGGERTVWFNAMTATPQILVLLGVAVVIATGATPEPARWFAVFALASALPAMAAWRRLHETRALPCPSRVGWRRLAHYGLGAWLTAALATAAIVAMQRWVEVAVGRAALGQFTMAMTLVQVPLTPINYAAPLLFRRWMEQPGERAARRWSAGWFAMMLTVAALVAVGSLRWPDLGLGVAYAG